MEQPYVIHNVMCMYSIPIAKGHVIQPLLQLHVPVYNSQSASCTVGVKEKFPFHLRCMENGKTKTVTKRSKNGIKTVTRINGF